MSALLATAEPKGGGGGAPLGELAVVAGFTGLLTVLTVGLVLAHRRGGAPRLRRLEALAERVLRIPGWAAVPGLGAVGCATIIILGATWDIGLHIDVGRDEGPLGTIAHYPLLLGLFGAFLMGVLAVGLAPTDHARTSPVAFAVRGVGTFPAAAVLLLAGAAFGMAAFPLDDLWHRTFGQDVTLWGPTHTMIIGGTLSAGVGGALLLVEGAYTAGRQPFGAGGVLRRPLGALVAGIFLYLWAAATHEFNWGVPQYRMVWQPLLLAFGAAQALVLARVLCGRGGTFAALAVWLPVQVFMTLAIGGPLEVTMPAMPLFVAEALLIELVAGRRDLRREGAVRFGLLAGLVVGTLGFAAEFGWSQLVMPLPWTASLLPEAIPVAAAAGVSGGLLGALMAQGLLGTLPLGRKPLALALAGFAVVVGLGVNAASTSSPQDVTATVALTPAGERATPGNDDRQPVADLTVSFSDPSVTDDAQWVYALAWQGGGAFRTALQRQADGSYRSTTPVPVGGTWKTFVRVHAGRTMLSVPVRMAPDPAIGFAGFPARSQVTRAMVPDTELMQIERREDAPMALWTPATIVVLALNGLIIALLCAVVGRIGVLARKRAGGPGASPAAPTGRTTRSGSPAPAAA